MMCTMVVCKDVHYGSSVQRCAPWWWCVKMCTVVVVWEDGKRKVASFSNFSTHFHLCSCHTSAFEFMRKQCFTAANREKRKGAEYSAVISIPFTGLHLLKVLNTGTGSSPSGYLARG